jgi:YidC/Oxa1 family membrane protein insertase
VFLGLFHVLRRLQPTNGRKTLYGWTAEQFDSASQADLFKAPIAAHFTSNGDQLALLGASGVTVKIVAGTLVAIMIVTTYLTSRQMILKTGWSEDPQQRMIQKLMLYGIPFSLLISGGLFPIGVVIYWVTTNLFSLGQQFWVLRKYPPPPMAKSSGAGAGARGTGARGTGSGARAATATKRASRNPFGLGSAARDAAAKKDGKATPNSKPNLSKGKGKTEDGKPAVDGRSLAPRPGAKPVNRKKGGPARRQSG